MKVPAMLRGIWGAVFGFSVLLNGCAILTVDVDVYKGSLVNEERVQLHQLVAIATAAKPMLIQLRDNLEWPNSDGLPPKGATLCPSKSKSWYEAGYVAEPESFVSEYETKSLGQLLSEALEISKPNCQLHFQKPHARGVNAILSLYEDLSSPDLAPYGKRLREALEQLRRAKLDFELSEKRDQAIYDEIAAGFMPEEKLSRELVALRNAYKELLISSQQEGGPSRKVGGLMEALRDIKENNSKEQGKEKDETKQGLESELVREWKGIALYKEQDKLYERRLPFRAVWKLIGEGGKDTLLWKATRKLCVEGDQGDRACQGLADRSKNLADAYWQSRGAVREIWEESLSLLMRIERLERERPRRYRDLRDGVIALVAELTNVRQIGSALDRLRGNSTCSFLGNALERGLLCEIPNSDVKLEWNESNVKANPERFELILRQALSAAPSDVAHFLLDLDSLEKKAVPQGENIVTSLVEKANKDNSQRVVRLGLNHSYIDDGKLHDSGKVFQSVDAVSRNLAQGFERGRLFDGLSTLTENYLKSHDSAAGVPERIDENKLLDALVEFAQKILFLANHEGLASPPGTKGLFMGGVENIVRGLFGDQVVDGYYKNAIVDIGTAKLPEAKKVQYVRVLQAVGNSILFSANELRERERYRIGSESKVGAEVAAVNLSRSPDSRKILESLLGELKVEKAGIGGELTNARARAASLQKELNLLPARLTELHAKEMSAQGDLNAAQAALKTYQTSNALPKELDRVLTDDLAKKIREEWIAADKGDATTVGDFLTGSNGLAARIHDEVVAKGASASADEIKGFQDAGTYLADPKTEQAFTATPSINANTPLRFVDRLGQFLDFLRQQEQNRRKNETALTQNKNQIERGLNSIQQTIKDETSRGNLLNNDLQQATAHISKLPNDETKIDNTIKAIDSLASEVRKKTEAHTQFSSPSAVYLLLGTLLSQAEANAASADKPQFQDAQTVLSKRMPPPAGPPLYEKDYKSPQAVMDEVIALLRHRQIDAVERFGKGSDVDNKATEALENAYQHRAGMLYIRPSSAYLRTSYPSTSLQDDPNLAWDNMLLQQGIRNLPFSSQLRDILDPSGRQDRLLTSELDKQYWQNINRVRVSGTGFTNQVVVKDDVGNWYVKQYYGDTEDIIKSAKNLALFNLGTKLPINLAGELKEASKPKGDTRTEAGSGSPPLNQVLEKHRNAYQVKTAEVVARLDGLHTRDRKDTVYGQIVKAWENIEEMKSDVDSIAAMKAVLSVAIREWDEAAEALKSKSDQDLGQLIVKDLRALSRVDKSLSVKIQEIDKKGEKPRERLEGLEKVLAVTKADLAATPDDSDKKNSVAKAQEEVDAEVKRLSAVKSKATAEMRRVVGPIVLDMLKDRKQTLDSYDQAIMFIGDATNPKDVPAK